MIKKYREMIVTGVQSQLVEMGVQPELVRCFDDGAGGLMVECHFPRGQTRGAGVDAENMIQFEQALAHGISVKWLLGLLVDRVLISLIWLEAIPT